MSSRIGSLLRHPRATLVASSIAIPASFMAFTSVSSPRLRCHNPEFSSLYFITFELAPYVHMAILIGLSIWLSVFALRTTKDLIDTGLLVLVVYLYSVFAFALVYYMYGIISHPSPEELFAAAVQYGQLLPTSGLGDQGNFQVLSEPFAVNIGERFISIDDNGFQDTIEDSRLNYLLFSLGRTLPGFTSDGLTVCSGARALEIIQSVVNLALNLITLFLVVRVSQTISPSDGSHTGAEKPRDITIERLYFVGSHEPHILRKKRLASFSRNRRRKS